MQYLVFYMIQYLLHTTIKSPVIASDISLHYTTNKLNVTCTKLYLDVGGDFYVVGTCSLFARMAGRILLASAVIYSPVLTGDSYFRILAVNGFNCC